MSSALPTHTLLILAGGRSSRMGQDKAAIPFPGPTDPPLVRAVADRLAGAAAECLLAAPDTYGLEVRRVLDRPGLPGPLGGLVGGLEAAATDLVLVVAADMPGASPALARELLRLAGSASWADAVVPVSDDGPEPLFAAYRRRAAAGLGRAGIGRLALRAALRSIGVRWVAASEWRRWDPLGESFADCDTPSQLARAAALAATRAEV